MLRSRKLVDYVVGVTCVARALTAKPVHFLMSGRKKSVAMRGFTCVWETRCEGEEDLLSSQLTAGCEGSKKAFAGL